ncbi:hypothetical protein DVP09_07175 [Yersinia enterocolitica]|nr:hypothetical protein [Yersinia enterocolitica]EKN5050406.1 hypothetical protein [Yersinia enterocolitica]EKN5098629.1 hypothetical protein [Yersinia enterocolitica]EKN6362212.1 hypothetical protein [Yersinia enterocolitica]EKN6383432.1 hypothetical protein [Yersinia enterocolitica]
MSGVGGSNPLMPTKYPKENQSVRVGFFVCGIGDREIQGKPKGKTPTILLVIIISQPAIQTTG